MTEPNVSDDTHWCVDCGDELHPEERDHAKCWVCRQMPVINDRLLHRVRAILDRCARCRHDRDAHAGDKDCICGNCMWFEPPEGR